jgi:hypothetical protein
MAMLLRKRRITLFGASEIPEEIILKHRVTESTEP